MRFAARMIPFRSRVSITNRGEIVEVGVFGQGLLRLVPCLPQLRILHLQLDLVDLQFMDEPLQSLPRSGGPGRRVFPFNRSSARRRSSAAVDGVLSRQRIRLHH